MLGDVVWGYKMWCDVMGCDVMWYDVMWCDVMWCDVMCDWVRTPAFLTLCWAITKAACFNQDSCASTIWRFSPGFIVQNAGKLGCSLTNLKTKKGVSQLIQNYYDHTVSNCGNWPCDVMWCGMMWCDVINCDRMSWYTMWCDVMWRNGM